MIQLDQRSTTPLYEQIYQQLQQRIFEGVYLPGGKLPSIRSLAESLFCSRNTVEAAYQILMQEGFVQSKPGSGYTVSRHLYQNEHYIHARSRADSTTSSATADPARMTSDSVHASHGLTRPSTIPSAHQEQTTATSKGLGTSTKTACEVPYDAVRYDFTDRDLEPGTFPSLVWKSLTNDVLLGIDAANANRYSDSCGEMTLRREIARMLADKRNIRSRPEQVIVQGGTQAGLQNLLALFDPSIHRVAVEDPGNAATRDIFKRAHFSIHPCPVYRTAEDYVAAIHNSQAKLALATPSNQFPLGVVMDLDVRHSLIQWARETNAYIIEDDYCFEFNYRNRPLPSLFSLDQSERIIYMGTFSKSLSPALRVNFLVLPNELVEQWSQEFVDTYPSVSWLGQAVLSRYLREGHRDRQLRRVQVKCRRKYEQLMASISRWMGDKVHVIEGGAGLHVLLNVKTGASQEELIQQALSAGVRVYDTARLWIADDHPLKRCVLVGFSAISEEDIDPGIQMLAHAWFGQ